MRTIFFLLLIILNGLITNNINGQITETYFSDIENKEGGKANDYIKGGDYIIIGGQSFDNYPGQPSVKKIDTLGNVVWTTTSFDTTTYSSNNVYIHRIMLSGTYLYATCIIEQWPNNPKEVWKIDATNGNIIWKKPFYSYKYRYPKHIIDYDTNKFLIGYCDDYSGSKYKIRFAFIDKNTGDTLSTHRIGNLSWQRANYALAIDSQKNIYFTKHDSIFKVDSSNPNNIIWAVRHNSADILEFQHIYIDQNDSIYLFGSKDAAWEVGKVISINKNNGNLNWNVTASTGDVAYKEMVDKNGYIYITWRHTNVGGGSYKFWTTKIDKNTGSIAWNSSQNITSIGTPDSHSGGGQGAMSIDVDDSGDVFLTGYYGDANYGPESWGILKLDGNTGNSLYKVTITEDSIKYDNISVGIAVCVINNKPYFIGELQTYHPNYKERSKTTFIELENNSGDILIKKYITEKYQFSSKTIQIENYGANKTVVLKQIGRFSNVSLYDSNKNIIWEKQLLKNYMLFGSNLTINNNGEIIFSAYGVDESNSEPFFSNQTDSIYVFTLDSLGSLIDEHSFYTGVIDATPTEILNDGISTFVFYQKNNTLFLRKIEGNGLSAEYNLNISYNKLLNQTKCAINNTDSTILIFGYSNFSNRIIELNKTSLNITSLGTIPKIHKINFIAKNGDKHVLLCGQNYANEDILIDYNTVLLDTVWTKAYSSQSDMFKFAFNEDSSLIYSIGTQSADIVIRKIDAHNGIESWLYNYNGPSNLTDEPLDIVFDKYRNQLVFTGFQSETSGININKDVLIETIDTSGITINSYIKQGDFNGDNIGICAQILYDGSVWVGGNLNYSIYGKAGFIYEIDSALITTSIDKGYLENGFDISEIEIYPNPFLDFINIKYTVYKNNSNALISIHDVQGKTIYSKYIRNQQIGEYNLKINTIGLNGIYILRLQINNNVFVKKIISVAI